MDLIKLIDNLGFPIVVSVALFYQVLKSNDLVRGFQEAIEKNTSTIERLVLAINDYKNEVEECINTRTKKET